jgi:site-specific DNA recombinase
MRVAVYARVSTTRQAQAQAIDQQLDRLRSAVAERGWELDEQHVYRDDGYSGASLGRPGLDGLRDHAGPAELDLVLVTAPDRLARGWLSCVMRPCRPYARAAACRSAKSSVGSSRQPVSSVAVGASS